MQLSQISLAITRLGGLPFSPASLFAAGEQGVWYDPSDLTTLFQDSAGTTPVTAVEQPVGRMLDKSGRGNHATQATSTKRPLLSARVNLLTKTEAFDDAVWVVESPARVTIATNQTTAPNGTDTADLMTETTTNSTHRVFYNNVLGSNVQVANTLSCFYKQNTGNAFALLATTDSGGSNQVRAWFNLQTGTVGTTQNIGLGSGITATITPANNGFWRCSITGISGGSGTCYVFVGMADADGSLIYTGSTGRSVFIWGADLRVTNTGVNLPAYQYVNTSTDYATSGFPLYLKFDGVDDAMLSNSIDFTATDKMTVWSGVRKLSDAITSIVAETSTNPDANAGVFVMATAVPNASANYFYGSRGSSAVRSATSPSTYAAPITNVLSGISDISGDSAILRIDGAQAASSTADQGTGNYGNYPLYVGARNQTTSYLNGNLYSLIVRGAASTSPQISATETYVNGKTKAY